MNGGILKSQKLLAELTIKLHMSNQQHKSEMNCPMNVVSYAGLVRFLWEICFFHLEGGTIPPYCALQFSHS